MDRWRTSFELDPRYAEVMVDALRSVWSSERIDVITSGFDDDVAFATLSLVVPADAIDGATSTALEAIQTAASQAGLPPDQVPGIAALVPPVFAAPLDEQLSMEASKLFLGGHYDTAVLRTQAACEVLARSVFEDLTERRGGRELLRRIKPRSFSLADDRTRGTFFLLTGDWIHLEDWWRAYETHLKRRHLIVHAGGVVSRPQAESLDAAQSFRGYLREIWGTTLA